MHEERYAERDTHNFVKSEPGKVRSESHQEEDQERNVEPERERRAPSTLQAGNVKMTVHRSATYGGRIREDSMRNVVSAGPRIAGGARPAAVH